MPSPAGFLQMGTLPAARRGVLLILLRRLELLLRTRYRNAEVLVQPPILQF